MQIGLFQTPRMEQRLLQSPQMIQAMQILQLSSLDLQARIEQELSENPLLERRESQDGNGAADEVRSPAEAAQLDGLDAVLAMREHDRWDPAFRKRRGTSEEADKKHEALQNTPSPYHSLGASLLGQVALIELDPRLREMLEFLVFSLDARGYLTRSLTELVEECAIHGATEEGFALLLEELRHATHPALGARDLRECLLLQVDGADGHSLLGRLITEHLGDVAANRLPHIARVTGHSMADVGQAVELLRTLDPCPGSAYGECSGEVIRPEVFVEEIDGVFQVRLTRDGTPELGLSAAYTQLLQAAPRGDAVRKWVSLRLGAARWFIDALAQRQSTLLRIGKAIFERQEAFLQKGTKGLQPLRMAEVADITAVHLSTVSRAVAGKYVQTPHGILPLRSFFSGGTTTDSGAQASQKSVQERVKELVGEEDPSDPRSDDRLAELLCERDGIHIARRTVTKYRKVLRISSSSQRRVY